jgi:Protein of unknown function (DUF2971)
MPDNLFYFCSLNTEDRRSWLERTLVENQVYFRSREQLNDPNELRPSIIFEGTDKQIRRFVRHLILTHWPGRLSPANRLREENKLIYKYRNTPEWVEETLHEILDRVGLFCLSETSTDPLLWAHYADGHRGGACVEFDADAGFFLAAQQVNYTDQAAVINRVIDGPKEILEKSMLTKGSAWAYEQEWRVLARWHDEDRIQQYLAQHDVPEGLRSFKRDQHGPGYYSFPADAIRSVILGSRVGRDVESWLRTVIDRAPQAIAVKRAIISRDGMVTIE